MFYSKIKILFSLQSKWNYFLHDYSILSYKNDHTPNLTTLTTYKETKRIFS